MNSVVNYGILGHNTIFAQRIVDANQRGLVTKETAHWLVDRLEQNIGSKMISENKMAIDEILKSGADADWVQRPELIRLPHTKEIEEWVATSDVSEIWNAMTHQKSSEFENRLLEFDDKLSLVRCCQYIIATLLSEPRASHGIIHTHAAWNLVDHELIPSDLATLQVHRMLRKHLSEW
jgi:hypothetical protein